MRVIKTLKSSLFYNILYIWLNLALKDIFISFFSHQSNEIVSVKYLSVVISNNIVITEQ